MPYSPKSFMEADLKQSLTRDQVMEVIFFCFFDLERSLSHAFRAKLRHTKFFEELCVKEQEKKKRQQTENKRRNARIGRDAMMMSLAGNDASSYNLGQFIDAVRNQMQLSNDINILADSLGLNNKSNVI